MQTNFFVSNTSHLVVELVVVVHSCLSTRARPVKNKQPGELVGAWNKLLDQKQRPSRQPKNNMHGCVRSLKGLVSHVKMLSGR